MVVGVGLGARGCGTPTRSSSRPALSILGSAMCPVAQAIALGPVPDGSMKPQLAAQAAGKASRMGSMPVAAMIPATTGMMPLAAATLDANSVMTTTMATSTSATTNGWTA